MGTTVEAVNALVTLMTTISNMTASAGQISAIIQKAQAEGRTTLTDTEWAVVKGADDSSRQALLAAIQTALSAPKAPAA